MVQGMLFLPRIHPPLAFGPRAVGLKGGMRAQAGGDSCLATTGTATKGSSCSHTRGCKQKKDQQVWGLSPGSKEEHS